MISVIVPFYNAEATLELCVKKVLNNSHTDFEIILVNDGSTDKSIKIAKFLAKKNKIIRLIDNKKNLGAAATRNRGIKESKGDKIVFIDVDNMIPKDTLKKFANSKPDITTGVYDSKSYFKNPSSKYKNFFLYNVHMLFSNIFWSGCTCVNKYVFEKLMFNESIKGANVEDTDFGIRCLEQGFSIKTDKSIKVVHAHKHTLLSLIENDFQKARGLAKLRNGKTIGSYVNIRLYLKLLRFLPFLIISHIAAGLGFICGKLDDSYLKQIKNIFFKKAPVQLTLFVTNRCNAKCLHCLNPILNAEKDISLEKIKEVSQDMPNFIYLLISGGEPFLRDDLPEIVNTFLVNNKVQNTVIATNGSLPEKIVSDVKRILSKYRNHLVVNVSIDALGEDHNSIKNLKNSFENAIKTIKLLKTLKYPNFDVGAIITVTKQNQEKVLGTYKYLKKLNLDSIAVNIVRGKPKYLPDITYYKELVEKINQENKNYKSFFLSKLNKVVKQLMREQVIKIIESGYQSPCYAGRLNVVISNDGKVYPCEMLNKSIGDLNKSSFKSIWKSKKARQVRKFISKTNCYCTEECNINMNILFNPKYYLKIVLRLFRRF